MDSSNSDRIDYIPKMTTNLFHKEKLESVLGKTTHADAEEVTGWFNDVNHVLWLPSQSLKPTEMNVLRSEDPL